MTIWICDDEQDVAKSVGHILKNRFNESHSMEYFSSISQMLHVARLHPKKSVDLLIADIRLKDESGIDAAALLQSFFRNLYTIFITGYPDCYYEEIFEKIKPFGYLAKPIKEDKLIEYVSQIQDLLQGNRACLTVNYREEPIQIPCDDILYLENEKRLLHIHCVDKVYTVYASIEKLLEQPKNVLVQCHKSFAVNFRYVRQLEKHSFMLTDGSIIPISRSYDKKARIQYFIDRGNMHT